MLFCSFSLEKSYSPSMLKCAHGWGEWIKIIRRSLPLLLRGSGGLDLSGPDCDSPGEAVRELDPVELLLDCLPLFDLIDVAQAYSSAQATVLLT